MAKDTNIYPEGIDDRRGARGLSHAGKRPRALPAVGGVREEHAPGAARGPGGGRRGAPPRVGEEGGRHGGRGGGGVGMLAGGVSYWWFASGGGGGRRDGGRVEKKVLRAGGTYGSASRGRGRQGRPTRPPLVLARVGRRGGGQVALVDLGERGSRGGKSRRHLRARPERVPRLSLGHGDSLGWARVWCGGKKKKKNRIVRGAAMRVGLEISDLLRDS